MQVSETTAVQPSSTSGPGQHPICAAPCPVVSHGEQTQTGARWDATAPEPRLRSVCLIFVSHTQPAGGRGGWVGCTMCEERAPGRLASNKARSSPYRRPEKMLGLEREMGRGWWEKKTAQWPAVVSAPPGVVTGAAARDTIGRCRRLGMHGAHQAQVFWRRPLPDWVGSPAMRHPPQDTCPLLAI